MGSPLHSVGSCDSLDERSRSYSIGEQPPISAHICLYQFMSVHISPYQPISAHVCPCLPISVHVRVWREAYFNSRDGNENFFLTISCSWREAYFNSRDGNENFFLLISCSRREREFLSLNLVLRDENENFIFQSWASRRERESRLRQFSREFPGITFIACLVIYFFSEKGC